MSITQLSIFVENKKGALAQITRVLADNNIDIRAMSVSESQEFGIIRLIVNDTDKAFDALSDNECTVTKTAVVAFAVADVPGGLANVVEILSEADINIEYMYAFIAESGKDALVAVRVNDNGKAENILTANGVALLSESDIKKL